MKHPLAPGVSAARGPRGHVGGPSAPARRSGLLPSTAMSRLEGFVEYMYAINMHTKRDGIFKYIG